MMPRSGPLDYTKLRPPGTTPASDSRSYAAVRTSAPDGNRVSAVVVVGLIFVTTALSLYDLYLLLTL